MSYYNGKKIISVVKTIEVQSYYTVGVATKKEENASAFQVPSVVDDFNVLANVPSELFSVEGKSVVVPVMATVDLGTLDYSYQADTKRFLLTSLANVIKKPLASEVSNVKCDIYEAKEWTPYASDPTADNIICVNSNGNIIIRNLNYTDATTFKQAMQGVMLTYETTETPQIKSVEISGVKSYKQYVSVDLGTLNWVYSSSNGVFTSSSIDCKPNQNYEYANILCSKYVSTRTQGWNGGIDKSVSINHGKEVVIKDTTYTDATTFKQAMNGVILYFEPQDTTNAEVLGTITLPNAPIRLDGINEAKDLLEVIEKENGLYKIVKKRRIDEVDLGTLDWVRVQTANGYCFYGGLPTSKIVGASVVANLVCSKYITDTYSSVYNNNYDKTIARQNDGQNVVIYDTSYTDATTFKQAMNGVMLKCELAEPIIEVIADDIEFSQISTFIELGGTLKVLNDNEECVKPNLTMAYAVRVHKVDY